MRFFLKYLPLLPVFSAIICLWILLPFLPYGIDLSDEGYGLMGISGNPDYNPFLGGSYITALFSPGASNFFSFRIAKVILQISTALFSGYYLSQCYSSKGSKVPFFIMCSALISGFMLSGGNFGMGLSYNSLSSCLGIGCIGVMAAILSRKNTLPVMLGISALGGWLHALHFFTRLPGSLLFSVCWFFFFLIIILYKNSNSFLLLLSFIIGLLSACLLYHWFVYPLPEHLNELQAWMQHIEGHSKEELYKLYDRSWQRLKTNAIQPFRIVWISAALSGVFFIFYNKHLAYKIAAIGFLLITFIGLTDYCFFAQNENLFTGGIIFHYRSAEPLSLLFLCIAGVCLPTFLKQHYHIISANSINKLFLMFMLLLNPFIMSVGTGNELFIQVLIQLPGLIAGLTLLAFSMENQWQKAGSFLLLGVLLWIGTCQSVSGCIEHPYRVQGSLRNQHLKIEIQSALKGIFMEAKVASFITGVYSVLSEVKSDVVIDLCKVPGILFISGKHTPCNAWFSLQTPKANAWFIEHSKSDISSCSFILPQGYTPDSLFIEALRSKGNPFPEGYVKKKVLPHYLKGYAPLPFEENVEVYVRESSE